MHDRLIRACPCSPPSGAPRESELYVLMLLAALGTVPLTGANDLMLLVAAYLLASIPLYALAGFAKDDAGTEASLKCYLLGTLLGIVMLAGATVLFGVGGDSGYATLRESLGGASVAAVAVGFVGVLGGLLFKVGAVPAHFRVPDVTEGTRPPVAAFLTTVPKIGGVIAAYRLVSFWPSRCCTSRPTPSPTSGRSRWCARCRRPL